MTLDEIDRELPNGFHDAEVRRLSVDFVARIATLELDLWIGSTDLPPDGGRETYRPATIELQGLSYVVVDPPDSTYPYARAKPIRIEISGGEHRADLPPLQPGAFASRFFVQEWNAFIAISALDARMK